MTRALGRAGVLLALVVAMVLTVGAAYAAGFLGAPSVTGVDNRFAGVNASTTLVATDIGIHNPNPIGVGLGGLQVDYTVGLNDVALANGSKQGLALERGNSILAFTTAVANERLPAWWVSHVRNGEHTTLRVEATVTSGLLGRSVTVTPVERPVDTDVLSAFNSTETRPVNAGSPFVSDPVLYVNETRAAWGDVSTARTPIDMAFVVYNPKPVPYTITEIRYTVSMNDLVVGEGATDREHVIEPHTGETIAATTAIRNSKLDEWWVSHLERDQVTTLRIEFSATVEIAAGQTVEVPLDALTYTETLETDLFDTKAENSSSAGAATPTPTPDGTPVPGTGTVDGTASTTATDRDGGTATSTRVPTPTGTAVPTPTVTPTDGLIGNVTTTDVL